MSHSHFASYPHSHTSDTGNNVTRITRHRLLALFGHRPGVCPLAPQNRAATDGGAHANNRIGISAGCACGPRPRFGGIDVRVAWISRQCPMRCVQAKPGRFLDGNPQICRDHWLQPFARRWWHHIREGGDEPNKGSDPSRHRRQKSGGRARQDVQQAILIAADSKAKSC
jgi:hypothetical protein